MKLIKRICMFISLFFNINKNYFFEKYGFIRIKEKKKNIFFKVWYIFKNQFLVIVTVIVVQLLFKSDLLCSILIALLFLSMLFGMDTKDWRLFYRADFVSEIPETRERFFTVLMGSTILKLFVENNLILTSILFSLYTHISLLYFPLIAIAFTILYGASTTVFFMMQSSTFKVKKIFSMINYVFSFMFTVGFVYFLFDFILLVFLTFIRNLSSRSVLPTFIKEGISLVNNVSMLFINNGKIIIATLVAYVLIITILNNFTLNYIERTSYLDKEDSSYIIENFFIVKVIKSLIAKKYEGDFDTQLLVNKELALFTQIYKYNFKDYFFIFVADRSIAFLIAIFLILLKFMYSGTYLLMFLVIPIILIMDINSSIGVKLITNMSFITDYNTLLIANTSGFNLKELVSSKLKFFYGVKAGSYLLFFVIYNAMFVMVGMPWVIMILANMINFIILYIFPKLYFANNLIYCRMNYKDYQKYLDETKILDFGVSEFYPLNFMFKLWVILIFPALIFTTLFSIVDFNILIICFAGIIIISTLIVHLIMNRIHNNIINFIVRGNYSADFAKIFKG